MLHRTSLLRNVVKSVVNIAFSALILIQIAAEESEGSIQVDVVNCKGIERYMTQDAIDLMQATNLCIALQRGIQLDPTKVKGCLNDKILVDEPLAARFLQAKCEKRRKRSFALDFNLANYQTKKWPIPVPYTIGTVGDTQGSAAVTRQAIRSVLDYIANETCVSFTQQNASQILSFQNGQGCLSYQGRSENQVSAIVLTSACYSFGEILSLVATSLGLADDSARPDSGGYVYVNTSNIDQSNVVLQLPIPPYSTYNFPYDYASVIHSAPLRLTTNGEMTFRTIEPLYQNTIGQRVQMSFLDTKLINSIYCSASCSGTSNNCARGGYPDPKSCGLCKCPDGWSNTNLCQSVTTHDTDQCGEQSFDLSVVKSGTIQSPGYDSPGYYDPNAQQQCTWLLTAPIGSHVKITFLTLFGIYQYNRACYHWIEVRFNGSLDETGPRFCGISPLAQTITSKGNQMMLLFRSFLSADTKYKGFKIQFEVDPCTTIWSDPMVNTLTYGGTEVPGQLSKYDCLTKCEMTPWCYAVDLDYTSIATTKFPTCFLLNMSSLAAINDKAQDVVEYRITQKCPLITTTPPSTTTLTTSTSTTSTTTTTSPTTSSSAKTTSTTPGGLACFTPLIGIQSSGAQLVSSGNSVAQCQIYCLSIGCFGVDYVTTTSECFAYTDASKLQQKYPNPAINQYINICNASSPTTSSTSTSTSTTTPTTTSTSTSTTTSTPPTTSTTTSTTTTTPPTFSMGPTVCPTITVRSPGVQSSGATRNSNIQTEADCVNYCLMTVNCVGVDIVVVTYPQECWVYSDSSQLGRKFSNNDVVQYTFTRNCQSAVPTTTPFGATNGVTVCQPSWQIYNNSHSVGATKSSTPMLLNDCLNSCTANAACVAVDFNSKANPMECWIHTNPGNINTRYASSDLTQYVLTVRCPSSPPSNPGCGGANGSPGVLYPPCSTPTNPPSTCTNKVITFVFAGGCGCWNQRVTYTNVPCVVYSCSGNARLATVDVNQQCVVPGWGPWSSCSASCGSFGVQTRYRYDICGNNQYITVGQEQQRCNTQACPCSGSWGCSRCCSGFYEISGYCYSSKK